jgi:hypothetical protein
VPLACAAVAIPTHARAEAPERSFPRPELDGRPRHYVCYRTEEPLTIDGSLNERAWDDAPWTAEFVGIEGPSRPAPRFSTRARMLWDDRYLYVAAVMEEPHLWATLTERDAVIFHDNDFEVFIDPDGDTHEYYELEVNALGTEWDLLLTKPYRDGGTAIDSWDIQGLLTGVGLDGTLNDPGDTDGGWCVELAVPWSVLEECAHGPAPPEDGDAWRVNFSRVEWRLEVVDGTYIKSVDPETGEQLPEDNWVWSPQGLINMHYPEMWGFVQFSTTVAGEREVAFRPDGDFETRRVLFELYYAERDYHESHGTYTDDLVELGLGVPPPAVVSRPPTIDVTPSTFEASTTSVSGATLHISHDGHIW